jgi:alpha-L-arabinofuranosidase
MPRTSTAKLIGKRDKGHAAGESLEVAGPVAAVPTIDAVVRRSADGKRIFIKAANTDPANAVDTRISLMGVAIASHANTSSTPQLASPGRLF